MIHTVTYASCNPELNVNHGGFGEKPVLVNSWYAIQNVLANTDDHVVWVVTTEQRPGFLDALKKYDLSKYLVVAHITEPCGSTNRNYPNRGRRLKIFIMKGAQ